MRVVKLQCGANDRVDLRCNTDGLWGKTVKRRLYCRQPHRGQHHPEQSQSHGTTRTMGDESSSVVALTMFVAGLSLQLDGVPLEESEALVQSRLWRRAPDIKDREAA